VKEAVVASHHQDGRAERCGLVTCDRLVAFDGSGITGVDDLVRKLDAGRIGRSITVTALRWSTVRELTVAPVDHAARQAAPERVPRRYRREASTLPHSLLAATRVLFPVIAGVFDYVMDASTALSMCQVPRLTNPNRKPGGGRLPV